MIKLYNTSEPAETGDDGVDFISAVQLSPIVLKGQHFQICGEKNNSPQISTSQSITEIFLPLHNVMPHTDIEKKKILK